MENETNNLENQTAPEVTQETNIQDSTVAQPTEQSNPQPEMTSQVPTNTEKTQSMAPILDPKEQKNNKGIIIAIVIAVAIIGLAGIVLLPKLLFSNKKVVENEVKTIFSAAKKTLKNSEKSILEYDLDKDSLGVNGTLTIDSNYKEGEIDLTKLKNYKINYQGAINKKSNEASAQIGLSKESKNLIDIASYINGKNVLISLGEIYDKGLTTTLEKEIKELDFSKNQNIKDLETLLDKTEKIVKNTIDEKNIKKSNEKKEINGKTDNYTKIEYRINTQDFTKKVLKGYQEDPEIIKILSNLTEKSEKEIKDLLKEEIDNLKESTEENNIIINNYVKGFGNELKEIEIISEEDKIVIDKEKDIYTYYLEADGEKVFNGEYNKKEESFTLKIGKNMSFIMTTQNDSKNIVFEYKEDNQSLTLDATIKNKVTSSTQENNTVLNIAFKMDEENITATIENDMKITKNSKVEKTTKTPTINIEDISDAEEEKIMNALYEKLSDLVNDIMPGLVEDNTSFRTIMG